MSTQIYAFIMSLIDGKRSLQDMEHLMREARNRKLDAGELKSLGAELVATGEDDSEEIQGAVDGVERRLSNIGARR